MGIGGRLFRVSGILIWVAGVGFRGGCVHYLLVLLHCLLIFLLGLNLNLLLLLGVCRVDSVDTEWFLPLQIYNDHNG